MQINGRFLTRTPTGVDRFAYELLYAWGKQVLTPAVGILAPTGSAELRSPPSGFLVNRIGHCSGHLWEQFELPAATGEQTLINLCNTAPCLRENQLVVIHDAATIANPANFSLSFRLVYRAMIDTILRRSRVVATVSKFSAGELNRWSGRGRRAIEVIYEGGEHILRNSPDTSIIERLGLTNRRFVLAVGTPSLNKNFGTVLAAMRLVDDSDLLLVAAGSSNSRIFSGDPIQDPRIVIAGYVSDAELRAMYEHAVCFAFPSFYEGFGLPALEAMCCGCPVIVSNSSSLPEVCGDAALYCDPSQPASLAKQLRLLLGSAAAREELREAGYARAAVFGWDKAARRFAEIVEASFR
jgi:glycosyltransferase involved in cell wall biosynthesis